MRRGYIAGIVFGIVMLYFSFFGVQFIDSLPLTVSGGTLEFTFNMPGSGATSLRELFQGTTPNLASGAGCAYKPSSTFTLYAVEFHCKKVGAPGTVRVNVYMSSGEAGNYALPMGSPIATSTSRAATTFSTNYGWEEFYFQDANQITLTAGQSYCFIVISLSGTFSATDNVVVQSYLSSEVPNAVHNGVAWWDNRWVARPSTGSDWYYRLFSIYSISGLPSDYGNLNVIGTYDGIPVACSNVYYNGPSGSSAPINIPASGYTWSSIQTGSYTVYGTYNSITRSSTVTVTQGGTAHAQLNFGGASPQYGSLNVIGYADGIPVACSNVYYNGPSGQSAPISIPASGQTWSNLDVGSYTVHGTYQGVTKSDTVTVSANSISYAALVFSGADPSGDWDWFRNFMDNSMVRTALMIGGLGVIGLSIIMLVQKEKSGYRPPYRPPQDRHY